MNDWITNILRDAPKKYWISQLFLARIFHINIKKMALEGKKKDFCSENSKIVKYTLETTEKWALGSHHHPTPNPMATNFGCHLKTRCICVFAEIKNITFDDTSFPQCNIQCLLKMYTACFLILIKFISPHFPLFRIQFFAHPTCKIIKSYVSCYVSQMQHYLKAHQQSKQP